MSGPSERPGRIVVTGWVLGSLVYLVAYLNRTSLGVAGLLAEHRFHIASGQLSVFVLLQVGVYVVMQIPTGVLVDRYGPRRLLLAAALIMAVAQLIFALAPSYPVALLARLLLGCGDALTFISALRYAGDHFSPRAYPVLAALTGAFGVLGNLIATLPLAVLLHSIGWVPVYLGCCVVGLASGVAVALFMQDHSPRPGRLHGMASVRRGVGVINAKVRESWGMPGTRLGFWLHFSSPGVNAALGLLWGSPYLQKACGYSSSGAGVVLLISVVAAGVSSPVLGWLIGRHPHVRTPIAIGFVTVMTLGWCLAVAWGDHPARWYVVALFVVTGLGNPISMFAFAVARDYNHARVLGTASGVVNVGGWTACVIIGVAMGWVADALGGTTAHALRWALLVAVAVELFGIWRMSVWWLRTRAHVLAAQDTGREMPVPVVRRRWDLVRELAAETPD